MMIITDTAIATTAIEAAFFFTFGILQLTIMPNNVNVYFDESVHFIIQLVTFC